MRQTRSMSGARSLAIIAVAVLVISTTGVGAAQAFVLPTSRCPCNFAGALLLARNELARFGHPLTFDQCTKSETGIALTGSNAFCALLELEVEDDSAEPDGSRECGYEFACPAIEDGDAPLFILKSERDQLTKPQFRACVADVKLIASLLGVPCSSE